MIDMPTRHMTMGPQDIKLAPGRLGVLHRRQPGGRRLGARRGGDEGAPRDPDGSRARTGSTSPATPSGSSSPTAWRARSACSTPTPAPSQATWRIGEHASPDMGNVTADGTQLWLSGRYDHAVYVLSAADGHLIKRSTSGTGRTACASGPSRAATRSATPASPGRPARARRRASRCRRTPNRPEVRTAADPLQHPSGRGHQAARRGLGPHLRVLGQRRPCPRTASASDTTSTSVDQLAGVLEGEVGDGGALSVVTIEDSGVGTGSPAASARRHRVRAFGLDAPHPHVRREPRGTRWPRPAISPPPPMLTSTSVTVGRVGRRTPARPCPARRSPPGRRTGAPAWPRPPRARRAGRTRRPCRREPHRRRPPPRAIATEPRGRRLRHHDRGRHPQRAGGVGDRDAVVAAAHRDDARRPLRLAQRQDLRERRRAP